MKFDVDYAMAYQQFVWERHRIWERRMAGEPAPWTDDPTLATRKFTHVFRVLDWGTQYLLTKVLDPWADFEETAFRVILYRYVNRPEPWDYFFATHGHYPDTGDADYKLWDCWNGFRRQGNTIFGPAYRTGYVPLGTDRLRRVLDDARDHFRAAARDIAYTRTQREIFDIVEALPRGGPFMAMQITTDLGYTDNVRGDENAFIVAGPGAQRGLDLVFPGVTDYAGAIRWVAENWMSVELEVAPGIRRAPSLMDVQNTFCEYSKYVRGPGAKPYRPAHERLPAPVYPNHWRNQL